MKVLSASILLFFSSAGAFSSPAFVSPRVQCLLPLAAAKGDASNDLDMSVVRKAIMRLDKDNFHETLSMVEPFLLNESGITFYTKSIRRINRSAKALGMEVPADFAKEAKATAKKREKQNAFVQAKIEEAKAAAEEQSEETGKADEEAAEEVAEDVGA